MCDLKKASKVINDGGIIAYPTEAVYGFGCDPFNETAVLRLLKIKRRAQEKGLILVAANWKQIKPLINFKKFGIRKKEILKNINATWPGPVTWLFPATKKAPDWITGGNGLVAIRISAHPTVKCLCEKHGGPIVSTSANICGIPPSRTAKAVREQFSESIDFIMVAKIGKYKKPTIICDAVNGNIIRG